MIGSIISAILWFVLGAVVSLIAVAGIGLWFASFVGKEDLDRPDIADENRAIQEDILDLSHKIFGNNNEKYK